MNEFGKQNDKETINSLTKTIREYRNLLDCIATHVHRFDAPNIEYLREITSMFVAKEECRLDHRDEEVQT